MGHEAPCAILAFCRSGLGTTEEVFSMCDYSLHNVKSRPAKVGDKLTTHCFNTGTIGFAAPEDANTAVCVLPGKELAFATAIRLHAMRVVWLEDESGQSHDRHLSADQQRQPAHTS